MEVMFIVKYFYRYIFFIYYVYPKIEHVIRFNQIYISECTYFWTVTFLVTEKNFFSYIDIAIFGREENILFIKKK